MGFCLKNIYTDKLGDTYSIAEKLELSVGDVNSIDNWGNITSLENNYAYEPSVIEAKRAEAGFPTLEAAGRPPCYIASAADPSKRIGSYDPNKIKLVVI